MASRSLNKVQLIGHVGRDPEIRYLQSGSSMTTFSIATNRTWTDRTTNERKDRTDWHNIVCWGRTAEIASQYLHKGSYVFIEGELQSRSFEREGQKQYRTEVNCRELIMLDRANSSNDNASYGQSNQSQYDRPSRSGGGSNTYNQGYGRQQTQPSYNNDRFDGQDMDTDIDSGTDEDLPF